MPTIGLLYPGFSAEDDFSRLERRLGADLRLPVVHTSVGEDAHRVDALLDLGATGRLAEGARTLVEEHRPDSIMWACTSGSFVFGWQGAHDQVRELQARTGAADVLHLAGLRRGLPGPLDRARERGRVLSPRRGRTLRHLPGPRRHRRHGSGQPRHHHRSRGRHPRLRAGRGHRHRGRGVRGRRGRPHPGHGDAHPAVDRQAGGRRGAARAHRQPGHGVAGDQAPRRRPALRSVGHLVPHPRAEADHAWPASRPVGLPWPLDAARSSRSSRSRRRA